MNEIVLAKTFVPMLDEAYQSASLTAVLDGAAELARHGASANELIIPMIEMQGLADYRRNDGYVAGDVRLTSQTKICNFDRGRMFTVDTLDNEETASIAFGRLAGEFIRTKVVPELDAFRFAAYAGAPGIRSAGPAKLETGEAVVAALRTAMNQLDADEVPYDERFLFITPQLVGLIEDMENTRSVLVLERCGTLVRVPQSRFYTGIVQQDGLSGGQEEGGFVKAASARPINFLVVHKPAVIQYQKHVAPKIIKPGQNQDADAWKFGYRSVGIADVYENKRAGVYVHSAPVA